MVRYELGAALSHVDIFRDRSAEVSWETLDRIDEATEHFVALSDKNPRFPKYTNAVAHTFFKLGDILDRQWGGFRGGFRGGLRAGPGREKQLEAGASYREAADRYANLIRWHPDALGYRAWYAVFLQAAATSAFQSNILEQAEELFQESVANWKTLIELDPENSLSWEALPIAYETMSRVQHEMKNHLAAERSLKEAEMSRIYRDMYRGK